MSDRGGGNEIASLGPERPTERELVGSIQSRDIGVLNPLLDLACSPISDLSLSFLFLARSLYCRQRLAAVVCSA